LPAGCYLDANLLVLLVVGATDRALVRRHRRLQEFNADDYERLVDLLGNYQQVLVTPNTLTETSNLLSQHGEPQRSRFFDTFRSIIEINREIVVASRQASGNASFKPLGLTDAALLEVVTADTPLITVDLDLYLEALAKAPGAAINFTHLQHL
jgi:hypothetical protein